MRFFASTISAVVIGLYTGLPSTAEKLQPNKPSLRCEPSGGHESSRLISLRGINFGPYIEDVRSKIYSRWNALPHRERKPIVVRFAINGNGTIGDVGIEQSAASNSETALATEVITASGPFAPLPRGFSGPISLSLPFNVSQEQIEKLAELNRQAAQTEMHALSHDAQSKKEPEDVDGRRRAQGIYEQALALSESIYGPSFPQTSFELEQLVPVYEQLQEWDKAIAAIDRLLKYYRLHQSVENTRALVDWLWKLGDIYAGKGDISKAGSFYEESVALSESHGLRKGLVCPTLYRNKLGDFYVKTGQYTKAELAYKGAVEHIVWDSRYGMDDSFSGIDSLDRLARFYFDRHRFKESEALYKKELAVYEDFKKPFGFSTNFEWFAPYIEMLRKQGRDAEAEEVSRKVRTIKIRSGSFNNDGNPLWERK